MIEKQQEPQNNIKVLYASFSQDKKFFLIGTKEGCTIYQSDDFSKELKLRKNINFKLIYKYRKKR